MIATDLRNAAKGLFQHKDECAGANNGLLMERAAREIERLRASLRINGLRQGIPDIEIDKVLNDEAI